MGYRQLYLFVEGPDDKRFFNRIIRELLSLKYDYIKLIEYAGLSKKELIGFTRGLKGGESDYMFVSDLNDAPCVSIRKEKIIQKYRNKQIAKEKIVVVVKKIEGWYLAGLNEDNSKRLRTGNTRNTEKIDKIAFDNARRKKFDSREDFMIELLNCYSVETATTKNRSFKYFIEKFCQ
jgi:predicted ATP-dependent endonuclease of OLD family